jgi:hypothetical protein
MYKYLKCMSVPVTIQVRDEVVQSRVSYDHRQGRYELDTRKSVHDVTMCDIVKYANNTNPFAFAESVHRNYMSRYVKCYRLEYTWLSAEHHNLILVHGLLDENHVIGVSNLQRNTVANIICRATLQV